MSTVGISLYRALVILLLVIAVLARVSSPNWYYCRPILDGGALECMPASHQLQIGLKKDLF